MMTNAKVYVPVNDLSLAVQDKGYMLALSLNLYIKFCFRSSVLKDASIRKVMHFAGIGYKRAKAAIQRGLESGLLSYVGNDLYASKLRTEKWCYCYGMEVIINPLATTGEKRCGMSFTKLTNNLRKAMVVNHISKLTECSDSIYGVQHGLIAPSSKRAKRINRMSDKEARPQLSNKRAAQIAGVCKTTVRRYLKELVASGECSKHQQSIVISKDKKDPVEARYLCEQYNKQGLYGWLFAKDGQLMMSMPNIYRYEGSSIAMKYNR